MDVDNNINLDIVIHFDINNIYTDASTVSCCSRLFVLLFFILLDDPACIDLRGSPVVKKPTTVTDMHPIIDITDTLLILSIWLFWQI